MEFNTQTAGNPETGYWLNFTPPTVAHLHEFCGPNDIPGAVCPNCNTPLLKLAVFSAADPVLALDPARTPCLPLLYCWTCAIPYGEFRYEIQSDGSVRVLTCLGGYEGAFGVEGPYEGYTGQFPLIRFSLEPQSEEERRLLRARFNDAEGDISGELADPRHQVGGYPMIYNPQADNCPQCSAEMPLFASIADNALGNGYAKSAQESFTDNSGVQMIFLFCRGCSIVSAYHSCD
jgi:hypothetical protein